MWRAFIILFVSIGILGGGFYYFANNEGWFDHKKIVLNENASDNLSSINVPNNNESIDWLDYKYQQNGVLFSTKYPVQDWKIVEQLNGHELTIIFTNNDSCQIMYWFDIQQGQYKSELSNNKNSETCAEILQKIVSIATIPQFGVSLDEENENLPISSMNNVGMDQTVMTMEKLENSESSPSKDSSLADELDQIDGKVNNIIIEEESESVTAPKSTLPSNVSTGISDQEIYEMTAQERYDSAKAFVNNWLLEYAKRRWSTLENQLSINAKASLGGETLASVANPFYYYELLTILKQISLTQYQVNVKLTTKEEIPIGSADGIYTLNVVWEYGAWKMDNYIFE